MSQSSVPFLDKEVEVHIKNNKRYTEIHRSKTEFFLHNSEHTRSKLENF